MVLARLVALPKPLPREPPCRESGLEMLKGAPGLRVDRERPTLILSAGDTGMRAFPALRDRATVGR